MPKHNPQDERELATLDKIKVEVPRLYEVVLHNDDYTTQVFVVYVLMKFFHHDADTANEIMMHVHTKGSAWLVSTRATWRKPRQPRWSLCAQARDAAGVLGAKATMLSSDLEKAVRQALADATRRGHEFSGLEHLLLALLDDATTADIIKKCGGALPRLRQSWRKFLPPRGSGHAGAFPRARRGG
jgi:ATP-dependent Clp protease adapter protein ClpS